MVMTTMSCVSRVLWEPLLLLELVDVNGPSMAQYRSQPVAGQADTASWLWEQVMLPMPLAGQSVRLACREVGMENPLQPAGSMYPAAWHSSCLSFSDEEVLQPWVTEPISSEYGASALNSGRHALTRGEATCHGGSCGSTACSNHTSAQPCSTCSSVPQARLLCRCFTPAEQAWPAAYLLSGIVWAGWPCNLPAQCGSPTAVEQMWH